METSHMKQNTIHTPDLLCLFYNENPTNYKLFKRRKKNNPKWEPEMVLTIIHAAHNRVTMNQSDPNDVKPNRMKPSEREHIGQHRISFQTNY